MKTIEEQDRAQRWYAALHADALTRRVDSVLRLADQEQAELRAEIERLVDYYENLGDLR